MIGRGSCSPTKVASACSRLMDGNVCITAEVSEQQFVVLRGCYLLVEVVLGEIMGQEKMPFLVINCNLNSRRYNVQILQPTVLLFLQQQPHDVLFQQDNARQRYFCSSLLSLENFRCVSVHLLFYKTRFLQPHCDASCCDSNIACCVIEIFCLHYHETSISP